MCLLFLSPVAQADILIGPIVNAAWGFDTGLGLLWFRHYRAGGTAHRH